MSSTRSVHFPPIPGTQFVPASEPQIPGYRPRSEYARPDIVLLGSIRAASDVIAKELKVIGEEREYHGTLTVLVTQSRLIHEHAAELLRRYEANGGGQ